jgi:KWG repeat domain protein
MALSIYNLIESVCNPAGRFKTLREIGVKTDEKGDPVFSYSGTTISFSVVWKGRSYLLKCSLREEQENTLSWRRIAAYLQRIRSSFLVGYYYLSGEMLVFNDRGAAGYIDVVLMEYPDHMQPLDEFLEKACMEGDKERIRKLLTEFCQMAVWLINDNLVHGAIRASNVMIDKDCSVHLVNYEYMQMPRSDAPDYESIRDADNVMVANLALGIKAVASDPAAFRYLKGNAIFRFPVVRSPLLPMFADVAREAGCEPVLRIVEMLSCSNHTLHGRLALSEALRKLSGDRTELGVDLSVKLANERRPSAAEPDDSDARREEYLLNRTQLQSFYCWVGPVCESLICVRKGDLWGYVDCSGNEALPLRYEWASDFMEGRAEVMRNGCYGLIDKTGKEILPAIYELVEWNSERGIAKVACDGLFGLCDRDGKELVPFIYRWMGGTENDLILVFSEKHYGYIRQDGTAVIPFRYDDAYDFKDGTALVVRGGKSYKIDMQGREEETTEE